LTIFNLSSPCRIRVAEEKAGGIVVRKIDDEGFRLRERVGDGTESPRFSPANVVLMLQFPGSSQFEGIGADTGDFQLKANDGGKGMFHILWYLVIGLLSGLIAKSVMHEHMTMLWTIVLGIVGSLLGGGVTHMIFRSKNERYHPAGLIFSTLGAILILFICFRLKIHLP
jgi:uncharacterized membrane protein YeaQ/YmgE (transglycosylase-associated protein family)